MTSVNKVRSQRQRAQARRGGGGGGGGGREVVAVVVVAEGVAVVIEEAKDGARTRGLDSSDVDASRCSIQSLPMFFLERESGQRAGRSARHSFPRLSFFFCSM